MFCLLIFEFWEVLSEGRKKRDRAVVEMILEAFGNSYNSSTLRLCVVSVSIEGNVLYGLFVFVK